MKTANNRFLYACVLSLAMGLSASYGCGGEGGGAEPSAGKTAISASSGKVLYGVPSRADENNAGDAVSRASGNYPGKDGVTQSSNAANGVTTDRVSVEASYEEGQVRYRVQNSGGGWSVDSGTDAVVRRFSGIGWDRVELMKGLPGGNLYVDVHSEDRARQNKDYLAGGLWIYVPDGGGNSELSLGAFADGNDPFRRSDLSALTGTAVYGGEATVMYSDENGVYPADASVALTVDFDRGTVKGRIHFFVDGGGSNVLVAADLEEANIGDSDGGFFSGETDVTEPDSAGGEGKWGGQFLGNGYGTPRTAAGTFGFTTGGGVSALGAWSARSPAMLSGGLGTSQHETEPGTDSPAAGCGADNADGGSCTAPDVGGSAPPLEIIINPDGSCEITGRGISLKFGSGDTDGNGVNICKRAAELKGMGWIPDPWKWLLGNLPPQ